MFRCSAAFSTELSVDTTEVSAALRPKKINRG